MKKILTLALAATMLTTCFVTVFATEDSTQVTYTVDPAYTVVIPESVTLSDTEEVNGTIKIYGSDENSNVVIGKNQKVNVALTNSLNDFNVKNADGDTIAYTVNDKSAVADLTTVAECAAGSKQDTDIAFKKTGDIVYSGTYTDTLIFDITVEKTLLTLQIQVRDGEQLTLEYEEDYTWQDMLDKYSDILSLTTWSNSVASTNIIKYNGKELKHEESTHLFTCVLPEDKVVDYDLEKYTFS